MNPWDKPDAYRCPECNQPEGRRHACDAPCRLYPHVVVKPEANS